MDLLWAFFTSPLDLQLKQPLMNGYDEQIFYLNKEAPFSNHLKYEPDCWPNSWQ